MTPIETLKRMAVELSGMELELDRINAMHVQLAKSLDDFAGRALAAEKEIQRLQKLLQAPKVVVAGGGE